MSVHHMYAWSLRRGEENSGAPEKVGTGGDGCHVGAGYQTEDLSVRARMLFTISPALTDGFLFLTVSEMAIFHTSGHVIKNTNAIYCC